MKPIIEHEGGEPPEWVELLPLGEVTGRDGRTWKNDQPGAVIAAFAEGAAELPVDVEHATEIKAPKGEPAPAAGWIKEMKAGDGALMGRVAWNSTGAALVAGRQYRYLSPVIVYDPATRRVVRLSSVALTNKPNLRLKALNREEMQEMDQKLLEALGLKTGAGVDEAVAAVAALKTALNQAQAETKAASRETASREAANRETPPNLEKYVPRADFDAMAAKAAAAETALNTAKEEKLTAAIDAAIGEALKAGKITPATVDYHKAQCRQAGGLERFAAYVAAAPEVGGKSGIEDKTPPGAAAKKALNAEENAVAEAIAKALGITKDKMMEA